MYPAAVLAHPKSVFPPQLPRFFCYVGFHWPLLGNMWRAATNQVTGKIVTTLCICEVNDKGQHFYKDNCESTRVFPRSFRYLRVTTAVRNANADPSSFFFIYMFAFFVFILPFGLYYLCFFTSPCIAVTSAAKKRSFSFPVAQQPER